MAGHRSAPIGAGRRKSGDGGPREWRPSSAMRPQGAEQGSTWSNDQGRGSGKRKPPHPQPPAGSTERAGEDGGLPCEHPPAFFTSGGQCGSPRGRARSTAPESKAQRSEPCRGREGGSPKARGFGGGGAPARGCGGVPRMVEPSRKALGSRRAPTAVRADYHQHGRGRVGISQAHLCSLLSHPAQGSRGRGRTRAGGFPKIPTRPRPTPTAVCWCCGLSISRA